MRQIKFRIWDGKNKNFYYSGGFCFNEDGIFEVLGNKNNSYKIENKEDFCIIQQYTELKDSKGKEIYEGDIIKYVGKCDLTYKKPGLVSIGEFIYDRNVYFYGVRVKRIDMKNTYFGLGEEAKDYLIIGNVFQNPELLNG